MHRIDWKHTGRFFAAALSMDFSAGMVLVVLPFVAMNLGAASLALGVLTAVRAVAHATVSPLAGLVADRYNRKVLITISCFGNIAMLAAIAAAGALWQLFPIVVVWGATISIFWPPFFSWLGDAHAPEQLGRATGAANMGWSVGSVVSGPVAGVLFLVAPPLAVLLAIVPVLSAWGTMMLAPQAHARPRPRAERRAELHSWKILVGAWLGSVAACALIGLMSGVFPKLGTEIGVTSALFGAFICLHGLGRTFVFLSSFWWSGWLRDWRLCALAQVAAAVMVATVCVASSHWWLLLVFVSMGFSIGSAYYRSLYLSLEGGGSSGLKSSLHESALFVGILIGSVGGGTIAHFWGLRAPYVPMGALVLTLVIVQVLLILSAKRAQRAADQQLCL